ELPLEGLGLFRRGIGHAGGRILIGLPFRHQSRPSTARASAGASRTCVIDSRPMSDEIRIRSVARRADFDACVALQKAVWRLDDLEVTSAIHLIASVHAGAVLQIAETPEGRAIGFVFAFPALRGGVPHLHSDMLAVLPGEQAKGVGARLKWAQREEA